MPSAARSKQPDTFTWLEPRGEEGGSSHGVATIGKERWLFVSHKSSSQAEQAVQLAAQHGGDAVLSRMSRVTGFKASAVQRVAWSRGEGTFAILSTPSKSRGGYAPVRKSDFSGKMTLLEGLTTAVGDNMFAAAARVLKVKPKIEQLGLWSAAKGPLSLIVSIVGITLPLYGLSVWDYERRLGFDLNSRRRRGANAVEWLDSLADSIGTTNIVIIGGGLLLLVTTWLILRVMNRPQIRVLEPTLTR